MFSNTICNMSTSYLAPCSGHSTTHWVTELGEKCRQEVPCVETSKNVPSLNSFMQTILLNSDRKASGSTWHFNHNGASVEGTSSPSRALFSWIKTGIINCCWRVPSSLQESYRFTSYMQVTFAAPLHERVLCGLEHHHHHHLILSPYKVCTYLPILECLRTLGNMLYKTYHTFWMNLEYHQPIVTMDVLTETLNLKLKLTPISSL